MSHVLHVELQIIILGVEGVDDLGELGYLLAQLIEHVVRHHVMGLALTPIILKFLHTVPIHLTNTWSSGRHDELNDDELIIFSPYHSESEWDNNSVW